MKAVVMKRGPDTLELIGTEKPVIGDHDVLVKVHAATVSSSDVNAVRDFHLLRPFARKAKPREPIPGVEFAGEIEEVGTAVQRFKTGTRSSGRAWPTGPGPST